MTIDQTTHRNRMREPKCPPWCAGHDERYQTWEEQGHGYETRNHESGLPQLHRIALDINAVEHPQQSTRLTPTVEVMVDIPGSACASLTPAQARQVAARLVTLAEQAEEWLR